MAENLVLRQFGAQLARESHPEVDVVVPVPDSGVPAAVGYSQYSGVPFELGIIRNHYVGRTFIQPTQSVRELGVRMKHSANRAAIEGKRIVLVDDHAIVRQGLRSILDREDDLAVVAEAGGDVVDGEALAGVGEELEDPSPHRVAEDVERAADRARRH